MPNALNLDDELSKASDTVMAASDVIAAHCEKGDEDAVRSALEPYLSILAHLPEPADDHTGLPAWHTLDLAGALRVSTSRGLPGVLLISALIAADDARAFLSPSEREEAVETLSKYRRFDTARLAEIAADKGHYQESRDYIEALRDGASEEETIMLDQMMKQITGRELNQRRLALWLTGGILLVLLAMSIFNLLTGSGPKPVPPVRPIVLDNLVKPLAGLDNPLFTENELRYCKAFYAVLYKASSRIEQTDQALVQRYKDSIDDYAKRCTKYRYKPEDMNKVEADMTRLDVDGEAAKLISAWQLDISLEQAHKRQLDELRNRNQAQPQ